MELRIDHVSKAYGGQAVLRDVTVAVGSGVTCLMAPSGAGKTTLLRILLGLERPDSGTVHGLEGRRLAAAFQEDRLLEQQDWRGNLRFVLGSAFDEAEALTLLEEQEVTRTEAEAEALAEQQLAELEQTQLGQAEVLERVLTGTVDGNVFLLRGHYLVLEDAALERQFEVNQ